MGVVNVTPDSFSDGGLFLDPERAIAHGARAGRPGRRPARRRRRVDPARRRGGERRGRARARSGRWSRRSPAPGGPGVPVSIDTSKAERRARRPSTSAPRSSTTSPPCAPTPSSPGSAPSGGCDGGAHAHAGQPADDAGGPALRRRRRRRPRLPRRADRGRGRRRRSRSERIWVDPGIGFGKTVEHNLELLRRLGELARARAPDRDRHLAQALPRRDHRARGRRAGSAARSPRTCSRSPPAPTCSGSTTSPPPARRSTRRR